MIIRFKEKLLFITLCAVLILPGMAAAQGDAEDADPPPAEPEAAEEAAEEAGEAAETPAGTVEEGGEVDAPAPVEEPEPAPMVTPKDFSIEKIIEEIKRLKEIIAKSEKRMNDIVSVVLSSAETKGSRIALVYQTEMSPDFVLVQAVFSLDGAPIFNKSDEDGLLEEQDTGIYDGAILPGKHSLGVTLVFRGHGYGILSYLSKYKFKVRSEYNFKVKEGKGVKLDIISFEKGDMNTKLEDRPAVKYQEKSIGMEQ
ncbi:MAG: hypothetical protein ABIJ56_18575 [Pseudomonadota bacterium]